MSYILKGRVPAGGLQSFVQQCIFNGASHEQEPYGGPREDRGRDRVEGGGCGWGVKGVVKWWGEGGKGGQGGAGETGCEWLAVFFALFAAPRCGGVSCKPTGGKPVEGTTFGAQTANPTRPPSTCWHLKMELHRHNELLRFSHHPLPTPLEIIHGKLPVTSILGFFCFVFLA